MKVRVIHIVSEVEKSHHLEWLTPPICERFDLEVVLIGKPNSSHEQFLRGLQVPVYIVPYGSRGSYLVTVRAVARILKERKPMIVHAHFWIANIVGIPVAFFLNIPLRIMTRHHGNLHHQFYRKGVWIDILLNKISTIIITPTKAIKSLLVDHEHTNEEKVIIINHGIDLKYYSNPSQEGIDRVRKRYGIPEGKKIIGVISRHIEWKGIQYIIPAFSKLCRSTPDAHLVLANANGDYKATIMQLLSSVREDCFTMIEYENDAASLYGIFDFFVHVPIDANAESFGLTYIEALAAGKPSVFTMSGIAPELIVNGYNALVVDYKNSEQIFDALMALLARPDLAKQLSTNGKSSAAKYSASEMGRKTCELYDRLINLRIIK